MKKQNVITIILLIVLFALFSLIQLKNQNCYDVLRVNSPLEIVVDKNSNGIIDDGETIRLLKDYHYITKQKTNLDKALHLDNRVHYALYYLGERFANEVLLEKKVRLKNDTIYLNNENYLNILSKSGFLFKDNKPVNVSAYQKRLAQIDKLNFCLYNLKSNKYHELDCKYGNQSHNYIVVPKSQLPKGAIGCKYCTNKVCQHKLNTNLANPVLTFTTGSLKIFLSDYTTSLKPNRYGNTEICNELVKQIDNAQKTIDIAIYGYDNVPKIERAIKRALGRGVRVRLIYDIDSKHSNIYANTMDFVKLIKNANCDVAPDFLSEKNKYTNSIMHNKFYIFDNERVITGSANFSHTDMSNYNSNCVILINSKEIANIYTREFNQMYLGKFHNLKDKLGNKDNIKLNDSIISVYYSPKDDIISNVIIPHINKSKKYIYIPTFLITEHNIANALIGAKLRGVDVKVIIDATNSKSPHSKHHELRQRGILVKTENYAGKLHSKSMIIDDKYAIIGSMNFSKSGNSRNDENVIVIENSKITVFYKKFFNYLWKRISDYWLTHDVSAESIYSIGSCSDGIDNDYDGKIDSQDEGCMAKFKK